MTFYDLIVVGSGVGLNILNAGLKHKLNCALIESGKFGGTCLTRGCIPSKVLTYPADLIRKESNSSKVGVKISATFDWKLIADRVWAQIDKSKSIEKNLKIIPNSNLTVYQGTGEFVEDYTMQVKMKESDSYSEKIEAEKIVIASGARSSIPPVEGLDEVGYVTSDSFFGEKFPSKPWKSLAIIGGGVIATEFAHVFSAFGTRVKIIEISPRLVSNEEPEISDFLKKSLERFMDVYTNKKAVEAHLNDDGKALTIEDVNTGERQNVFADEILVASGRRSNSDWLKPQNSGVEVDAHGWIKVDEFLETTMENIWSVGDANGGIQLRHRADYDAEICVHNLFSEKEKRLRVNYSATPWAIYSNPQIGHVGMTQKEAVESGHQIYVGLKRYSSVAKGYAMGFDKGDVDDGFVKLIVNNNRKILGAHVVGPHAAILVQPFVYLMNSGFKCPIFEKDSENPIKQTSHPCPEKGTLMPIKDSMIIHPSLNEVTAWVIGSLKPLNIKK